MLEGVPDSEEDLGSEPKNEKPHPVETSERLENQKEKYRITGREFVDYKRLQKYAENNFTFQMKVENKGASFFHIKSDKSATVTDVGIYPIKEKNGSNFYPGVRFNVDVEGKTYMAFFTPKESPFYIHKKTNTYSSLQRFKEAPLHKKTRVFFSEEELKKQIYEKVADYDNKEAVREVLERLHSVDD